MNAMIYLEQTAAGVRIATTAKADKLIQRMGRDRRRNKASIAGAIGVADLAAARKVRRVITRLWNKRNRGGGSFDVEQQDVDALLDHFAKTFGLPCYGGYRPASDAARRLALQKFARGRSAKWRGKPEDFAEVQTVLNEMLVNGMVTLHHVYERLPVVAPPDGDGKQHRRRTSEIKYRGSARSAAAARVAARDAVPHRGRPADQSRPPEQVKDFVVVPDPYMTREELHHQLDQHRDDPPDAVQPGYRIAAVNMRLLIGGLASIGGLTEAQKNGAQHFRQVADHAQLGGAKAIDYEVTRVDTSMGKNSVTDAGAAARDEYYGARVRLGLNTHRLAVAERMILGDESVRKVAEGLGYGQGGAARARIVEIARDAATVLAMEFGYQPAGRARMRFDGDRPDVVPEAFRSDGVERPVEIHPQKC